MALHKDLTGAELHEPKGAATAANGTVYVANGSGSGSWTARLQGLFNLNKYVVEGTILDVSAVGSRTFLYVPFPSTMTKLAVILGGPITTANAVLSIYVNGVLFADTLTIPFAGSTDGQLHTVNLTTSNAVPADSVIEIRSNGGSDGTQTGQVSLSLTTTS